LQLLPYYLAVSLWRRKGKAFCVRQFASLRQEPEADKRNVVFAPLKKFLRTPTGRRKCTSKKLRKIYFITQFTSTMGWIGSWLYCCNIFKQISKCKRGGLVPCGRHTCLLSKREDMMINSEKRKFLHDYYQSHILSGVTDVDARERAAPLAG